MKIHLIYLNVKKDIQNICQTSFFYIEVKEIEVLKNFWKFFLPASLNLATWVC